MGTTAWYLLIFRHHFALVIYYMSFEEGQRKYFLKNVIDYWEWFIYALIRMSVGRDYA